MTNQLETMGTKESLLNLTLKEIVTSNFNTAQVFEKHNLDFCCKGNKLFSEVIVEKKLNEDEIIGEIENILFNESPHEARYDEWELDFLVSYIVNNHHNYIRRMLPTLNERAAKIAAKHPEKYPWMIDVRDSLVTVTNELSHHMIKEEQILFPYVLKLVEAKKSNIKPSLPTFGTAENPIKVMEKEHENAGDELYFIRNITNSYNAPEDACTTFKLFYSELKAFEEDLHKHVHLENNILFPKTIALEKELL